VTDENDWRRIYLELAYMDKKGLNMNSGLGVKLMCSARYLEQLVLVS
jgi:hypothetical protein